MAPKDFEGLTEDEHYEMLSLVEGLERGLADIDGRKKKNIDCSRQTIRLNEDTATLINLVDSFNQRPRPTKPTDVSKPLIDHKARHLIRELHQLIEAFETLDPNDDEAAKQIINKGYELAEHYSTMIKDLNEPEDIWRPRSMYAGKSSFSR